jgi:hypothetical protein
VVIDTHLEAVVTADAYFKSLACAQVRGNKKSRPNSMLSQPRSCSVRLVANIIVDDLRPLLPRAGFGEVVGVRYDEHDGSLAEGAEIVSQEFFWDLPHRDARD